MVNIFIHNSQYARIYKQGEPFDFTKLTHEMVDTFAGYRIFILLGGLGAVFSLMAVVMSILLAYSALTQVLFHVDGVPVAMTVTGCKMQTASKGAPHPRIAYTYQVGDKVYNDDEDLLHTSLTCIDFPVGTQLDGLYLNADPEQSQVLEENTPSFQQSAFFSLVLMIMTAIFVVYGVIIDSGTLRSLWARWTYSRLRRQGQELDGELLSAEGRIDSKYKCLHVTVTYTFTTPRKRIITRRQTRQRNDLKNKKLPRKGARVKVLYAGDNACVML